MLVCILSPISLLLMGGWSEYGPVAVTENMAAGLGTVILLLMVAGAVGLFLINGMKLERYEYLEEEEIQLQYGVRGIVEKQREAFSRRYQRSLVLGVTLGVFLLVQADSIMEGFQKLLQEGDYSTEKKKERRKYRPLVGAYWCLVVAVYLCVSFYNNSWKDTWIVWPVAALLFVVLLSICRAAVRSRNRQ